MFKITGTVARYSKNVLRYNNYASAPITVALKNIETNEEPNNRVKKLPIESPAPFSKGNGNLIEAAFASLKNETISDEDIKTPSTDSRIMKAKNVDDLLSISEGTGVSRRHALKVVSVLSEWSNSGKTQLNEFDSDPRFIRLCKILTKGTTVKGKSFVSLRNEDLSTIINVTADDEAAKLITSISLPQMVKVMSTLSLKKRRSTPLLRSLAFNITRSTDTLDLKQSADLLYSAAVLNFIDENLLEKICTDVRLAIRNNEKGSAVIGSLLMSLGILRYKDKGTLDLLSEWIFEKRSICRPQDIFSLFITLAILNHQPVNAEKIYQILLPQLHISEANKPSVWLDVIWSLIVLKQANADHIATVVNEDFIKKLEASETGLTTASKLKLLNIECASKLLLNNNQESALPSDIKNVPVYRSKSKEAMIVSVQDSLSNLLNPKTHIKSNTDTGMGFYIDAELFFDKKGNPLPLVHTAPDEIKIAVMVNDFHDTCRGRVEPTGIHSLYSRLLEARGYRVLTVPYKEFNPRDKLICRVHYLETKLKTLVGQ